MKKLAVLAAALAIPAAHAQKACGPADMQKAQKAADMVVTWQQLGRTWKDWRHCDTGDVADTFTDALLRLLVEWKNVDALSEALKDPEFKGFIQAHLHSPAAKDDLGAVRSRAKQSCPKGQDETCKQIAAAVEGTGAATSTNTGLDLSPMAPLTVTPAADTKK